MWTDKVKIALIGMAVVVLAACGSPTRTSSSNAGSIPVRSASASGASGYGVVQAIDVVPREQAAVGVGTIAGAVVGGVLGNQVGSGRGRTAATVAGAAGGALAGRAMEGNAAGGQVYRVAVRMDNGSVQTLTQDVQPAVQTGERVRLENGVIVERLVR